MVTTNHASSVAVKTKPAKPAGPTFTHEELQALLFAATNNQGLENTGVVGGVSALAKLRKALDV